MSHTMQHSHPVRRPGRPKKADAGHAGSPTTGEDSERGTVIPLRLIPRLLDLEAAAAYLGVSPSTIRDLEAAGVLPRVRVPLPGGRELRKLLFDKADLDQLIDAWKEAA
jgi:excisionase family DNA binding protein